MWTMWIFFIAILFAWLQSSILNLWKKVITIKIWYDEKNSHFICCKALFYVSAFATSTRYPWSWFAAIICLITWTFIDNISAIHNNNIFADSIEWMCTIIFRRSWLPLLAILIGFCGSLSVHAQSGIRPRGDVNCDWEVPIADVNALVGSILKGTE